MKKFRKIFVNKILASVLALLLLTDTLPFTSYAVNGRNEEDNNKVYEEQEIKEPETKEPEKTETIKTEVIEAEESKTIDITESEVTEAETTEEPKTIDIAETEATEAETTEVEKTESETKEIEETVFNTTDNPSIEDIPAERTTYEVVVSKEGEGKIEIDNEETLSVFVEEGKSVEITMTPDDGYRVKDILFDSSSIFQNPIPNVSYIENDDNTSNLKIENINAAQNITIQFETIAIE